MRYIKIIALILLSLVCILLLIPSPSLGKGASVYPDKLNQIAHAIRIYRFECNANPPSLKHLVLWSADDKNLWSNSLGDIETSLLYNAKASPDDIMVVDVLRNLYVIYGDGTTVKLKSKPQKH